MMLFIATFISTSCCLILGGYALKFNAKSQANRYFAAFCFVTALWLVFYCLSLIYLADIRLIRMTMLFATFQSAVLFLFSFHFVDRELPRQVEMPYILAAACIGLLTLTPAVFSHTELIRGVPIPVAGIGMYFFAPFALGSIVASLILLLLNLKKSGRVNRIRTSYILVGFALTMLTIITTNFFGVILFHTIRFSSIGMVGTLFFISFSAFAMTRYRFLDVRAVLKKSLLYSFVLIAFSAAYILLAWIPYSLFSFQTTQLDLIIYTIFCSVGYTVLFQYVSTQVKHYLNGRFFYSEVDLVRFLNDDQTELNSTHELESFVLGIVSMMQDAIKAPVQEFFVMQKNYSRFTSFFPTHSRSVIHFDEFSTDAILKFQDPVLFDDLTSYDGHELMKILKKHKAKIYVPIIIDTELVAFALIGRHKNNVDFRRKDLKKLQTAQQKAASHIPELLHWQYSVENLRHHLKSQM